MFTPSLMLALIVAAPVAEAEIGEPLKPAILVRARADRVEYVRDGVWVRVTFRIEHVYSGEAKLKGTTFQKSFKRGRGGLHSFPESQLEPPMKEGEEGIWELVRSKEDGELIPIIHNQGTHEYDCLYGWSLAIPVPARRIIG